MPPLCYAVCEVIDMNLGENIRRTRLEHGLTQSALAETLGVSDRAVSRWERNISAPDVALLANLALVLGTSTDALLAIDPQRIQAEILRATEECTALLNQNQTEEAVRLLRAMSARYPNQPELMVYLARGLLALKIDAALQEALVLCRTAEKCGKPMRLSTTFGCKQVMALCLHHLDRMEEAERLVTDEMPAIWVSRELLLARVASPEKARLFRKHNVKLLSDLLIGTLEKLGCSDEASPWNETAATVRQALTNVL